MIVFEGGIDLSELIARIHKKIVEQIGGTKQTGSRADSAKCGFEFIVIQSSVHLSAVEFDSVVVGKSKIIAPYLGIPAGAAIGETVRSAFDGIVPAGEIISDKIVVPEYKSRDLVHHNRIRPRRMGVEPGIRRSRRIMNITAFHQNVFRILQIDSAVIVQSLPLFIIILSVQFRAMRPNEGIPGNIAVQDLQIGTARNEYAVPGGLPLNRQTFQNNIPDIVQADNLIFPRRPFQDESFFRRVPDITVRTSTGTDHQMTFEIFMIQNNGPCDRNF